MSHPEFTGRSQPCQRRARQAWAADALAVALAGLVLAAAATNAQATLATLGGQVMQNGNLVAQVTEQGKTVAEMMTTIDRMKEQFSQMLKAGASVTGAITGAGQQGLAEEQKRLTLAKQAFDALYKDVTAYNQTQEARFVEANTKGLTYAKYLQYEQEAIAAGNKRAIQRVQQEQRMLDAIKEDQALASNWVGQINGTAGIHQSMGLLNTQLNRYIQQQARVTQLLAQAQGTDKAVEEAEKARRKANDAALNKRAAAWHDQKSAEMREGLSLINGDKNEAFNKNTFRSNYAAPAK